MVKLFATIFACLSLFIGVSKLGIPPHTSAQEFSYQKAQQDYAFTRDIYKQKLADFKAKREAYEKNRTLSLKEEARLSLYEFLLTRNDYTRAYLTALRMRAFDLVGLTSDQKAVIYDRVDAEIKWFSDHKIAFGQDNSLEDLLAKSTEEDSRWETHVLPTSFVSLSLISVGDVVTLRARHEQIYDQLKKEATNLVNLKIADPSLFDRWFRDIENEIANNKSIEDKTLELLKELSVSTRNATTQRRAYNDILKSLSPTKASLIRINNFNYELENAIQTKR